jgi:hypothetical protein
MRRLTTAMIALFLSSCATAPQRLGNFASADSLWEQSIKRAEYRQYHRSFILSQNQQRLDDDSGCYSKGLGQKVLLILLVDAKGVISEAYADSTVAKAECFKAAYLGAEMPIPPFSPFPVKMQMN